jgi:hypothetical protein
VVEERYREPSIDPLFAEFPHSAVSISEDIIVMPLKLPLGA